MLGLRRARQNAGLSKEKTKRTVTWVGPKGQKKTALCVPGQSLRDIARGSGIPIVYDCQEGTCKTCEAMVGGGRAKIWCACVCARTSHSTSPLQSLSTHAQQSTGCAPLGALIPGPSAAFVHARSVAKMPNKDVTIKYNIRN